MRQADDAQERWLTKSSIIDCCQGWNLETHSGLMAGKLKAEAENHRSTVSTLSLQLAPLLCNTFLLPDGSSMVFSCDGLALLHCNCAGTRYHHLQQETSGTR